MSLVRIKRDELVEINLINTKNGMYGDDIKNTYNPNIILNAGLYDMSTRTNIVLLEDENVADGYYFADSGIGITQENDVCWCTYNTATASKQIKDYISGAPILVEKGNVNIVWGNKVSTQIQGSHLRTAIGFNEEEIILYCSDDSITLETLASRMKSYGCLYAINLDGGGSQYLRDEDKIYKESIRKNKSWFLFFKKNKKEGEDMSKTYKVTASALNVRSGAGTNYAVVGKYTKDTKITITEVKNNWGKTNIGWVSMSYVTPISVTGVTTVTQELGYLHPVVQKLCSALLQKCAEEGLKVGLFETYRSDERQAYLYSQGSTTIKTTGAHGFCVAFDIVCKDEKGNWTWDTSNKNILNTYKRIGEIGKSLGLEWGGSWTTLVDMPHFQYLGGVSLTNYRKGIRPTWWDNWTIGQLKLVEEKKEEVKQTGNSNMVDSPSDWAKTACEKAIAKKLIEGDGKGNYGWQSNLTLERFLVILDKLGLIDQYKK